jgi:hypothetical protein
MRDRSGNALCVFGWQAQQGHRPLSRCNEFLTSRRKQPSATEQMSYFQKFKFGIGCMAQELHVPKWEDLMSHKSSMWVSGLERGMNVDRRINRRAMRWFTATCAPDVRFLRSWLVYDSVFAKSMAVEGRREKFNWNFLIGMLVAGGASAGFWAGLGMAIANLR